MAERENPNGPDTGGPQPSGTDGGSDEGLIQTFLIADIRGYTRFSQDNGDEVAGRLASRFAEVTTEVIGARGGTVLELRGDEALCIFPTTRRALRAAIDLQTRYVEETETDPTLPLPVGVGIDTGEAVPVAGGFRGRALNLAARLCGVARAGEILATREAVHMAGRMDGVHVEDRGLSSFKNIDEPVGVIRVTKEGEDPARWFAERFPPQLTPARQGSNRRKLAVVATVVVVALVAAIVPITIALRDAGPGQRIAGDALGIVDLDSGRLTGSVALESRPGEVAIGEGGVWVTLPDRGEVVEIDSETRNIRDAIPVGADPSGIAIGAGSVWVSNSESSTVSRISLDTNRVVQTIPSPGGPSGIAVGQGGVWVANSINDSVSHIDPETGKVVAIIGVGDQPVDLVLDEQGLWVANAASGNVTLVDPDSDKAALSVDVGNGPHAIAAGLDGIWVSDLLDGTVTRIDPEKKAVSQTVDIGGAPSALAVGSDFVVVSDGSPGSVFTIDPVSSSVTKIPLGSRAGGLALEDRTAWVGVRGPEVAHRGGTLTVVAPSGVLDSIDPALAYNGLSWSILALGYDGLVGVRRVGGLDGGTLVPNLALSIPAPTEGGRTYTFQLREGIRYSNGDPIEPEDFQRAIERVLAIDSAGASYYSGIVGADQCTPGDRCHLSRGIVADDTRATVTFHLVEPDPNFIYGLGLLFASPVPAGTPDTSEAIAPIPTTGPYSIEPNTDHDELVLVRNRYFVTWSARPEGFPDRIVWRFLDQDRQVGEVLSGRADLAYQLTDRVPELATSHAGQVHLAPQSGIFYMGLNTQTPPFDDVRVRRALNFAVDRGTIAALFEGRGSPTCQILPSGFPGYVPYCPYTRDPGRTWTAPDLAEARELIARSGTAGSRVVVWASPDTFPIFPVAAVSRYFVDLLNELGYDAVLKVVPKAEFVSRVFSSSQGVPMASAGWSSDYTAESGYLPPLVTCGSPFNIAQFCDRGIERRMEEALRLQLTDPLAAHELWSSTEHQIVDLAPIVPLVDRLWVVFVSERLGNYQFNPQWGPLIDQMWVR